MRRRGHMPVLSADSQNGREKKGDMCPNRTCFSKWDICFSKKNRKEKPVSPAVCVKRVLSSEGGGRDHDADQQEVGNYLSNMTKYDFEAIWGKIRWYLAIFGNIANCCQYVPIWESQQG